MTDNEKLARWQGWRHDKANLLIRCKAWIEPDGITRRDIYPTYLNDDAAAMSLLDTLVEKGLRPSVRYTQGKWMVTVDDIDCNELSFAHLKILREAVVAAVLELIGKEEV